MRNKKYIYNDLSIIVKKTNITFDKKSNIILLDQVLYIKVAFNITINGKVIYNAFIHI